MCKCGLCHTKNCEELHESAQPDVCSECGNELRWRDLVECCGSSCNRQMHASCAELVGDKTYCRRCFEELPQPKRVLEAADAAMHEQAFKDHSLDSLLRLLGTGAVSLKIWGLAFCFFAAMC